MIRNCVLVGIVAGGLVAAGCGGDSATTDAPATDAVHTVTFSVDGMMCEESCAKSVREILAGQRGVAEATVDFEAKTATCVVDEETFDSSIAIADLADQDFSATLQN